MRKIGVLVVVPALALLALTPSTPRAYGPRSRGTRPKQSVRHAASGIRLPRRLPDALIEGGTHTGLPVNHLIRLSRVHPVPPRDA